MGKQRGLSLAEKREKVLSVFAAPDALFFTEKEIEQLAAKKGVRDGKDVLKTLVDDDLVSADKVGISRFFWRLASEEANKLNQKKKDCDQRISRAQELQAFHQAETEELQEQRSGEARAERLAELAELKEKLAALEAEFAAVDPEQLEHIRKTCAVSYAAANRWTDNIFQVQDFMKKKFQMDRSAIAGVMKSLEIPADLDNIDPPQ